MPIVCKVLATEIKIVYIVEVDKSTTALLKIYPHISLKSKKKQILSDGDSQFTIRRIIKWVGMKQLMI